MQSDVRNRSLSSSWPLSARLHLIAAWTLFWIMVAAGSVPGKAEAASSVFGDKPLHFLFYGLLSILLYRGLPGNAGQRGLGALLLLGMLGGIDEAIQSLLPYRTASLNDWLADMVGGALSVGALASLNLRFHAASNSAALPQVQQRGSAVNSVFHPVAPAAALREKPPGSFPAARRFDEPFPPSPDDER